MKVEESLNVTFKETPPPPKTSPLEDDELVEEEAIEVSKTKPIGSDLEDISLENNQIVNIKESKTHPLENVIDPTSVRWKPVLETFDIYLITGTWNINIIDETLDSSDNLDVNGMEKVEDSVDENSLANLNHLNDLKETINELASNEIQHPISKENVDQEDDINKVSPEIVVSSGLSRPRGFEHMKRTSSKCSTSFARYQKKDIKGVSLIEELSRLIEVGDSIDNFNSFIDNSGLTDLPLGGRLFHLDEQRWNQA
ncbi:hypothetical protein Tco_0248427 [Tanacetum coccineum]